MTLSIRVFLAVLSAGAALRVAPVVAQRTGGRRVLTLVYDKALGGLRAVDRLVP